MFKYIFIAVTLFYSSFYYSQVCNSTYSGVILDEHDTTLVVDAKVVFRELNKTFSTNHEGVFYADSLCAGTYNVLFYHHVGCEPVKKQVTIPFVGIDTVYLEYHFEQNHELESVEIRSANQVYMRSNRSVISSIDVKLAKGETFADIIKSVSGVTSISSGASIQKPSLRGMYGNRILTMVDNARLEGQQWGNEHAPELNPYMFDQIIVWKGVDAIRLGADAIGGVIDLNRTYLRTKPFGGNADIGYATNGHQLFGNLRLMGNFKENWSWVAQGSYKKAGTIMAPSYYLPNTAMDEANASFAINYHKDKWIPTISYTYHQANNGILSLAHVDDIDELYEAMEAGVPSHLNRFSYKIDEPRLNTQHHLATWNNLFILNEKNYLAFNYSFQYNQRNEIHNHEHNHEHEDEDEHEHDEHEHEGMELGLLTNQFSLHYRHKWVENLIGSMGANYQHQLNSVGGEYFVPNYLKNAVGIYWDERWIINANHFLSGGVRMDIAHLNVSGIESPVMETFSATYSNFTGALGYEYQPNHHLGLNFTAGNTWRTPSINELFSEGMHDAIYSKGNKDIKEEKALYLNVGGSYKSKRWNLTADIYSYYFFNYIAYRAMATPVQTDHGIFPSFEYTQTKASYSGIELFFDYRLIDGFYFQLKGSLVRAFDLNTKEHLSYIPADRIQPSLKFHQQLKNKDRITTSIGSTLVNKQYKAPIEYGFVKAPKGYALFDLSFMYSLILEKTAVDFILKVDNLFNTKYRDYMNRYKYFVDDMGRNIAMKVQISF